MQICRALLKHGKNIYKYADFAWWVTATTRNLGQSPTWVRPAP